MDNFLRKHDDLLEKYHFSIGWDAQVEVCDRLNVSKEITDIDAYGEHFSDLSWLDKIVSQHVDYKRQIESLPSAELVSIFFLSNDGLKSSLLPAPIRCLTLLKESLPPFFLRYANSILDQLSIANRDMSSVCYTVSEYVAQLEAVNSLEDVYEYVEKESIKVKLFFNFLSSNNFIKSHQDHTSMAAVSSQNVSNMLHSAFTEEELVAQAINQEMEHIAATMHTCRQSTDSQMAKFRNMHKDVDLKLISDEVKRLNSEITRKELNSSGTAPKAAVVKLNGITESMQLLRKNVETFKYQESVLISTSVSRCLTESNEMERADLRPRQFLDVDRLEESIATMAELWDIMSRAVDLEENVASMQVAEFKSEAFNSALLPILSDTTAIEIKIKSSTDEVLTHAKEIIERVKLVAASLNALQCKTLKGLYRVEVEALYDTNHTNSATNPRSSDEKGVGAASKGGRKIYSQRQKKQRKSLFAVDWPMRCSSTRQLVSGNLLEKVGNLRQISAKAEASSIVEDALHVIPEIWSKTKMRFAPLSELSTFNVLSNCSYLIDAVEQSRQVLNMCVQAPTDVLSYYGLTATLSGLRSEMTAIHDFVMIWEEVQNLWSSLFIAFGSHDAHQRLPNAEDIFNGAQREFLNILNLLQKNKTISVIIKDEVRQKHLSRILRLQLPLLH